MKSAMLLLSFYQSTIALGGTVFAIFAGQRMATTDSVSATAVPITRATQSKLLARSRSVSWTSTTYRSVTDAVVSVVKVFAVTANAVRASVTPAEIGRAHV